MKKESNPTWDYYKLLIFVVSLAELVLFSMAILFGRILGYDWTLKGCLFIGAILAGCFLLIVLFNLLIILIHRLFKIIIKLK